MARPELMIGVLESCYTRFMAMKGPQRRLIYALLLSNVVSLGLFGLRVFATDNTQYWFLFWNLLLAWVPVLIAWQLMRTLQTRSWKEPFPMLLTLLWLGFLPNSFYLMSDLIHLQNTGDIGLLFDTVLFLSCIWNGLIAGMLSLVWVHRAILGRRSPRRAYVLITVVLMLTSFAIYLGRSLRWNTWDLLVNPAGLLFDVSERVINPLAHPQVLVTTTTFFVLLSSMYWVVWSLVEALQPIKKRHKV